MTQLNEQDPSIGDLSVRSSVEFEDRPTPFTPDDFLSNRVALEYFIRDFLKTKKENEANRKAVEDFRKEINAQTHQTMAYIFNAIFSISGVILVGMGINYITSENPPYGSEVILTIGCLISFCTAILPIALQIWTRRNLK